MDSVLSRNELERPVSKNTCILPRYILSTSLFFYQHVSTLTGFVCRLNSRAGAEYNDNQNSKQMETINEEYGEGIDKRRQKK
jgi:hypothetical protein